MQTMAASELKAVVYTKISPKMVNPTDITGAAAEEEVLQTFNS